MHCERHYVIIESKCYLMCKVNECFGATDDSKLTLINENCQK